jgi:arsenate reductase
MALIKSHTREPVETVEYLVEVPTQKEIREILKMLGIKAEQLVRRKEKLYKEKYEGKKISDAEWVRILSKNPILIERPIVVKGNKAVIGRPVEKIIDLL